MTGRELVIPPIAAADPRARELIRVWAAEGSQHVSIAADSWEDPAAWGIALVDLARHISRAYEQMGKGEATAMLDRIREGFDAEWSQATDLPKGSIEQ
jgi:hypothetical protein